MALLFLSTLFVLSSFETASTTALTHANLFFEKLPDRGSNPESFLINPHPPYPSLTERYTASDYRNYWIAEQFNACPILNQCPSLTLASCLLLISLALTAQAPKVSTPPKLHSAEPVFYHLLKNFGKSKKSLHSNFRFGLFYWPPLTSGTWNVDNDNDDDDVCDVYNNDDDDVDVVKNSYNTFLNGFVKWGWRFIWKPSGLNMSWFSRGINRFS